MSQFKFQLESVERLRQRERDEASEAYQQALLAKKKLEEQITELQEEHDAQVVLQTKHMQNQIDVQRIMESRRYQVVLLADIAGIESTVREIEGEIERRRLILVQREQTLKTLEKLRERQLEQWKKDAARKTQAALDDWAGFKYWKAHVATKDDN